MSCQQVCCGPLTTQSLGGEDVMGLSTLRTDEQCQENQHQENAGKPLTRCKSVARVCVEKPDLTAQTVRVDRPTTSHTWRLVPQETGAPEVQTQTPPAAVAGCYVSNREGHQQCKAQTPPSGVAAMVKAPEVQTTTTPRRCSSVLCMQSFPGTVLCRYMCVGAQSPLPVNVTKQNTQHPTPRTAIPKTETCWRKLGQ